VVNHSAKATSKSFVKLATMGSMKFLNLSSLQLVSRLEHTGIIKFMASRYRLVSIPITARHSGVLIHIWHLVCLKAQVVDELEDPE
jgi:hypothetical protein